MLNQRNERRIRTRGAIIERALGLDIGPGLDREETLEAVDIALSRIEGVLAGIEEAKAGAANTDSRFAFRQFMARLRKPIAEQEGRVQVVENSAFMQIRSLVNGHRIYVSKGKVVVGRVDSTLPLGYVPGSMHPQHYNGSIRSWIPADIEPVSKAIELLGMEKLPPLRN